MDATVIIPAVVVGLTGVCTGLITAGSTLVAAFLVIRHQYQAQARERNRERARERLEHVRRYMVACLELSDLACAPFLAGTEKLENSHYDGWVWRVTRFAETIGDLPASGALTIMYVDDGTLNELLEKVRAIAGRLAKHMGPLATDRVVPKEAVADRERLRTLASKVRARCDELEDEV